MPSRLLRAAAVIAAALVSSSPPALAITLINNLGGPVGYGPNELDPGDDNSSTTIDLTQTFPGGLQYFGNTYSTFFVNNNGNITFNAGLSSYTPQAFPVASQPMIAPWWGDVDTRGGGSPMINSVWWYVDSSRVIVTWDNVGYYAEHNDKLNSFQLVLSTNPTCPGPGNFEVEFRYAACVWTTGDASMGMMGLGGVPAQAGFDAGNLQNYFAIPGSLTAGILNVCTTSNGGDPGDWIFLICDGVITGGCPGAGAACMVPGLLGVCAQGVAQCAGMNSTMCRQVHQPSPEVCDGLDNDCDGVVDDNIPPRACYDGAAGTEGVGVCRGGESVCTDAMFGSCMGEVTPSAEICDGLDNDCNGLVDDLPPRSCYTGPPGTDGVGLCHAGAQTCNDGTWGACTGAVTPAPEVCDGLDNDCNGQVDNGLPECFPEPIPEPPPDVEVPDAVLSDLVAPDTLDAASLCNGNPRCDPTTRLEGRAGPIGCFCRAGPVRTGPRPPAYAAAVCVVALLARRGDVPRDRSSGSARVAVVWR